MTYGSLTYGSSRRVAVKEIVSDPIKLGARVDCCVSIHVFSSPRLDLSCSSSFEIDISSHLRLDAFIEDVSVDVSIIGNTKLNYSFASKLIYDQEITSYLKSEYHFTPSIAIEVPLQSAKLACKVNNNRVFTPKYNIQFEQGGPGFVLDDLLIATRKDYDENGNLIGIYNVEAEVTGHEVEGFADIKLLDGANSWEDFENYADGIEFVRVGNSGANPQNQGLVQIYGEDGDYFFEVKNNITSHSDYYLKTPVFRAGTLDGINHEVFGELSDIGVLIDGNVFIRGWVEITSGATYNNIEDILDRLPKAEANATSAIVTAANARSQAAALATAKQDAIVNGKTLIVGGYVNTEFIDVKTLVANEVLVAGGFQVGEVGNRILIDGTGDVPELVFESLNQSLLSIKNTAGNVQINTSNQFWFGSEGEFPVMRIGVNAGGNNYVNINGSIELMDTSIYGDLIVSENSLTGSGSGEYKLVMDENGYIKGELA